MMVNVSSQLCNGASPWPCSDLVIRGLNCLNNKALTDERLALTLRWENYTDSSVVTVWRVGKVE